jgi:hypothetical protein
MHAVRVFRRAGGDFQDFSPAAFCAMYGNVNHYGK